MTAALEGGKGSAARPGRTLPPGKTRYPFYRRLSGPQGRSGRAENLVPTGIRCRTVQPVVSCYTDWATRPTNIRRYYSVHTAIGICHAFVLTGCWQDPLRCCTPNHFAIGRCTIYEVQDASVKKPINDRRRLQITETSSAWCMPETRTKMWGSGLFLAWQYWNVVWHSRESHQLRILFPTLHCIVVVVLCVCVCVLLSYVYLLYYVCIAVCVCVFFFFLL